MPSTIFDVAKLAGVSYATVSRILNGRSNVSDSARERVLKAVKELNYVANRQARSLAGGRSRVIGLLVRDLTTPYIGEIVAGVDEAVMAHGYELMLQTTHRALGNEAARVSEFSGQLAEGLIVVLPGNPESYVSILKQRHYPCVLVDHQGLGLDALSVGAANHDGAVAATRYLIGLGHRRIGFVSGRRGVASNAERLRGYRDTLSRNKIRFDPALVIEGGFSQPGGFNAARQMLAQVRRPTAIFAANDAMAFGAMEAAREQGLRIPDDISIIGFDNIPQAESVHPPLTTVQQPLREMGRTAARMLFNAIEKRGNPEPRVVLPTTLVLRASCAPPHQGADL